jgi:DNA processing protein
VSGAFPEPTSDAARTSSGPSSVRLLSPASAGYPALLAATPAPPALYVRGTLVADDALALAIVGARRATPYGTEVAERLAAELAARGVTIVSGLARGIDTAAHRGALEAGGRTIAVLGHGIDRCYPPENRALAAEIATRGALVSQFFPGTPPQPRNFPLRNRTIAALALGVVVVEAAEHSGALITAGAAADFGREVYAVPGRVTSETARGPHGLLRDGATLVRSWMDVVQELPLPWRDAVRDVSSVLEASGATAMEGNPMISESDAAVLGVLAADEARHIEDVIARCAMAPATVNATLMSLELAGRARQLEGQRWIAVRTRSRRG